MAPPAAYHEIAAGKQAELASRIPPEWRLRSLPDPSRTNLLSIPSTSGILTPTELLITETVDATALLSRLLSGELSAVSVATAFCKRAAIAHQLTACLTEPLFDSALARAAELDAEFARTGRAVGPLHGLPVSVKDTFRVAGRDASIGMAALAFRPSSSTCPLVTLLLDAGAVVIAKTNVPQTLMALDTHNNLFGRTLNPAHTGLTAGGSSGGEAALLAMRGACLGVGTDVGGSIRVPAMCHGLVGLKPSHGRVPMGDVETGGRPGADALGLRASAGPMGRSVRDCALFLSVVAHMRAWERDPEVVPLPWRGAAAAGSEGNPIMVGFVEGDGITPPLPPIAAFMAETEARLTAAAGRHQVEVVRLDIAPLVTRAVGLVNKFFGIDGGNTMLDLLESQGEPLSPWLEGRLKRKLRATPERIAELHAARDQLRSEFLQVWQLPGGKRLDALIAPVAPHPVPEIDRWNTAGYTSAFVLLDYAAGTLPVRTMQERDLVGECRGLVANEWDRYNRTLWEGDRSKYLGTSLCLQVVGERFAEEKVLGVMQRLHDILGSETEAASSLSTTDRARL